MIDNTHLTNDELLKRFKEKHKYETFEVITENELNNMLLENEIISILLKDKIELLQELIDGENDIDERCIKMFPSQLIENYINE